MQHYKLEILEINWKRVVAIAYTVSIRIFDPFTENHNQCLNAKERGTSTNQIWDGMHGWTRYE